MGLTPNRGYTTTDAGGADATEKRNITFDKQFGSGSTSNVMKIDADIHNLNAELDQANLDISKLKDKSKHPIPTVSATYVETIDEVDYYEATSDEITELYDKLIILLQLDSVNSGIINLKINSLTGVKLKKNSDGTLTDLLSNDLNVNTVYSFQYNGSAFCCIGNLNASDIKQTAIPGAETVDEAFSSIAASLDDKADLNSPTFTGTPTAPTAPNDTVSNQVATTAFAMGINRFASVSKSFTEGGGTTKNTFAGITGNPIADAPDAGNRYYSVISMSTGANRGAQLAIDVYTGAGSGLLSTRSWHDSAWTPWRKYIHNSMHILPATDNSYDLGGASNRFRNIYAATGSINTSDERQKKDISTLDRIEGFFMALNPVKFRYKDGTSGRVHHGLIAQEVEAAMSLNDLTDMDFAGFIKSPDDENEGESIYGLRYSEFIPMLIKMVQDQQKEIDALKSAMQTNE